MMVRRERMVALHCIVQLGMLLAIVWKWRFFLGADEMYHRHAIVDSFFPSLLRNAEVIRWAYLISVFAIAVNIVSWNRLTSRICSYVSLLALFVLCIHQGGYNDATFTTTWWTCLWGTWYVHRLDDPDRVFTLRRGAFLSRVIISMILLGGAVGKWTPEYWSGQVMHDIYFEGRDYWTFNFVRNNFEPETVRWMATWYSRKVILIETISGFGLWLLPPKWAAIAGFVLLTSIALFSNFYLFSVMFCLMGLSLAGLFVVKPSDVILSEKKLDLEA